MGHFPTKDQIKKDKDGKIHEMKEEYLSIENNSLKKVLFEENIISNCFYIRKFKRRIW
jgi:hypothetical protein